MSNSITLELRPEARAPATARSVLNRLEDLDSETRQTASLLVSELVTNALRHAGLRDGDPIALTVRVDPDRLHVEVSDRGRGFTGPPAEEPTARGTELAEGGYGLRIVDRLSDRWGVESDDETVVWFDIERRAGWTARN